MVNGKRNDVNIVGLLPYWQDLQQIPLPGQPLYIQTQKMWKYNLAAMLHTQMKIKVTMEKPRT